MVKKRQKTSYFRSNETFSTLQTTRPARILSAHLPVASSRSLSHWLLVSFRTQRVHRFVVLRDINCVLKVCFGDKMNKIRLVLSFFEADKQGSVKLRIPFDSAVEVRTTCSLFCTIGSLSDDFRYDRVESPQTGNV